MAIVYRDQSMPPIDPTKDGVQLIGTMAAIKLLHSWTGQQFSRTAVCGWMRSGARFGHEVVMLDAVRLPSGKWFTTEAALRSFLEDYNEASSGRKRTRKRRQTAAAASDRKTFSVMDAS